MCMGCPQDEPPRYAWVLGLAIAIGCLAWYYFFPPN